MTRLQIYLLALLAVTFGPGRGGAQTAPNNSVERLADGVYAIIRRDPEAFAVNANSLVIVGDTGVVVVDAQYTRAATLETLAAIRRLTAKPVRYVVNTHWHDDHVAGNQVYRDSFPDVQFVAHENTREDLIAKGRPNRAATLEIAGGYTARIERLTAQGLGRDSTPLTSMEAEALRSTVAITRQYVREAAGFRETLPTLTFATRLTLFDGARRVEVRYVGEGNTRGDAIVFVPDAKVLATGDLVVAPVPFGFNAYPAQWIGALDSLRALAPAVIVPGHGPVMHDDSYVRRVSAMLTAVRDQVAAASARGATLEETRRTVTLPDERRAIAGDEKWMRVLFNSFFLGPSVTAAWTALHPSEK